MPQIFQLTEEDVIRHNFDPEDVGTWCFVMNGCVLGFAGSRDEAEDMLTRRRAPAVIYVNNDSQETL
jgi:hypothetical protein